MIRVSNVSNFCRYILLYDWNSQNADVKCVDSEKNENISEILNCGCGLCVLGF